LPRSRGKKRSSSNQSRTHGETTVVFIGPQLIRTAGDKQAFLTIKGLTVGATRAEYEYEIPFHEGKAMLDTLAEKPLIEKKRYKSHVGGLTWEVDEFLGDNAGLIVAEVELKSEDQAFDRPSWLGKEITGDPRYYNANLFKKPFTRWQ
jgi:CYTH domain-containing protein